MKHKFYRITYEPIMLIGGGQSLDEAIDNVFETLPHEISHFFRIDNVIKMEQCDVNGDDL